MKTSPVRPARRGGRARAWPLAAGLLLAGGCGATGPFEAPSDVEPTSRIYEGQSRGAIFERTLAAVRASPLRVVAADEASGRIAAELGESRGQGWAECSRPLIVARGNDRGSRLARVVPEDVRVELTATVREVPEGVRVTLDPVFDQQMPGALAVMATDGECRSTGRLERLIFEAV